MDTNTIYENLPNGYIEKRKKATLMAVGAVYLFCVFSLLRQYEVIDVSKGAVSIIPYLVTGLNIVAVMHAHTVKRFYNNIPMVNHNEIKVFSNVQGFLMALPIIASAPFIITLFMRYVIIMGMTFAALNSFNKSYDKYDRAKSRY